MVTQVGKTGVDRMRCRSLLAVFPVSAAGIISALGFVINPVLAQQPEPAALHAEAVTWDVLDTYCSECHNFDDQAGGIAFELLPRDTLRGDAAIWEKAVRKIRSGLMPPKGQPRPPRAQLDRFVSTP